MDPVQEMTLGPNNPPISRSKITVHYFDDDTLVTWSTLTPTTFIMGAISTQMLRVSKERDTRSDTLIPTTACDLVHVEAIGFAETTPEYPDA